MENASMLLEDMRETSIDPDIITYSTIINGYCLAGDLGRPMMDCWTIELRHPLDLFQLVRENCREVSGGTLSASSRGLGEIQT